MMRVLFILVLLTCFLPAFDLVSEGAEEGGENPVAVITPLRQKWIPELFIRFDGASVQVNDLASAFKFIGSNDGGSVYIAGSKEHDALQASCGFAAKFAQLVAQRRLILVVSRNISTKPVTRNELYDLFDKGALRGVAIKKIFIENEPHVGRILNAKLSREKVFGGGTFVVGPRLDSAIPAERDAILKSVKKKRSCVGFVTLASTGDLDARVIKLANSDNEAGVLKDEGAYWFSESIYAYFPKPGAWQKTALGLFLLTGKGQKYLHNLGCYTPKYFWFAKSDRRLDQVKLRKGFSLPITGNAAVKPVAIALATDYTRAKEVAIPKYYPVTSIAASVSSFVAGRQKILISDHQLTPGILRGHKDRWNELKPTEHVIGQRAIGIIANTTNRLESITIEQLQKIYTRQVKDWSGVGKTNLVTQNGKLPITAYSLYTTLPASKLFDTEVMDKKSLRMIKRLKNTKAVLKEVREEPNAIGIVDITKLPENLGKLRLLPISTGSEKALVSPTIATIKSGEYTLRQPVYMYVHPKAHKTTKRFVQFVVTAGKSVDIPYMDTVQSTVKTILNNGLVPVAEGIDKYLPAYLQAE